MPKTFFSMSRVYNQAYKSLQDNNLKKPYHKSY